MTACGRATGITGLRAARRAAALLALLASGCLSGSQLEAVREFGKATAAVAELSSAELVQMRSGTIAMNAARMQLGRSRAAAPDHTDLDESFDAEAVQLRVQAAELLGRYAKLLYALADETRSAELARAADDFVGELADLAPAERRLEGDRAQAMSGAVQAIGRWAVGYRKARAIRRIVSESGPQVAHLAELLQADFDPAAGRFATGYQVTAGALSVAADALLDRSDAIEERRAAVAAYQLGEEHRTRSLLVGAQVARAAAGVGAAQRELQQALGSRRPSAASIRELASDARSLAKAVRVLR